MLAVGRGPQSAESVRTLRLDIFSPNNQLQAGFDLQLQKCILYPNTLEITRDNKIETQIPQNR